MRRNLVGVYIILQTINLGWSVEPDWKERSLLTLVNAVRMDPTGYRDAYLGNLNILLPANYPVVDPLYWDSSLSEVAQLHTEDMAQNCGMQHKSCDGTDAGVRIKAIYKGGGWWGENISTGQSSPLKAMESWLLDNIKVGDNWVPAPDKSDDDGHRGNIMSTNFQEMGSGYTYNSERNWNHFWTEDFGGGEPDYYPIPVGSHFFIQNNLNFMVNYFEKSGINVKEANVFINDQSFPMSLHLGGQNKGTFQYSMAPPSACPDYHFVIVDENDNSYRYPQSNSFKIEGGGCPSDVLHPFKKGDLNITVISNENGLSLRIANYGEYQEKVKIEVYNLYGDLMYKHEKSFITPLLTLEASEFENEMSRGIYFFKIKAGGTDKLVTHFVEN